MSRKNPMTRNGRFRENENAVEVKRGIAKTKGAVVGKPRQVNASVMRTKLAGGGGGGGVFGSGFGSGGGIGSGIASGGITGGSGGNFYSPELSTDFLELPQSLDEKRNYFRFFYQTDPFVGQAVDLHTELPLSKVRFSTPQAKSPGLAKKSLDFCMNWAREVGLLHRLLEIVHDYNLLGEVFVFCEDTSPDMPKSVTHEIVYELDDHGQAIEKAKRREDADPRAEKWLRKNFKGWSAIRVLPPEQIHMESFPFTDEKIMELIPDSKTKNVISQADSGDERAMRIVKSMPKDVVNAIQQGENIPLNTDPEAGSFVYYMARKKSQYEPRGHSILERCLRTLTHRDKLRQAQASIASRHMTPIRVIWAADMSASDTDMLREQVDLALQDPDYSIITNFEVNWNEMGSNGRLLELSSEYDMTDRQMYAGLGVTESLLSGESSYSGDRINLEVINTRYMLLREVLQDMVEVKMLRPMCRRMGYIETDDDGNETVICPNLSFTRLALRDNSDTFDALFNLYQKGSLDVDVILELLNIDPHTTKQKLRRDVLTLNDSKFNDVLSGLYGEAGRVLATDSNALKKIAEALGLELVPKPPEKDERF